jgi:hypothetical protein
VTLIVRHATPTISFSSIRHASLSLKIPRHARLHAITISTPPPSLSRTAQNALMPFFAIDFRRCFHCRRHFRQLSYAAMMLAAFAAAAAAGALTPAFCRLLRASAMPLLRALLTRQLMLLSLS